MLGDSVVFILILVERNWGILLASLPLNWQRKFRSFFLLSSAFSSFFRFPWPVHLISVERSYILVHPDLFSQQGTWDYWRNDPSLISDGLLVIASGTSKIPSDHSCDWWSTCFIHFGTIQRKSSPPSPNPKRREEGRSLLPTFTTF